MEDIYPWLFSAIILICMSFWIFLLTHSSKYRTELMDILKSKDKGGKSVATLQKIIKFLLTAKDTYYALNLILFITVASSLIGLFFINVYVLFVILIFFFATLIWLFLYIIFIIKIRWGFL